MNRSRNRNNDEIFARFVKGYIKLMRVAPRIIGIEALDFYKTSFRKQGQFIGGHLVPWKKRGYSPRNRKGRSLLKKSGTLLRSLNFKHSPSRVVLYSTSKYAQIQNDGATIKVTAKMRRFFYAMWKASGGEIKKGKPVYGDKFWFKMMMAKTITIPARPFFYDTPDLAKRIDRIFEKEINKLFNS